MELSTFILSLIAEGKVPVKGILISFTQEDIQQSIKILEHYYQEDILEMPYSAPAFSEDAALWASQYFYTAVQLTVLRDAGEDVIKEQLKPFPGDINPATIYSIDLLFRYLPALLDLAKGLSPADILVQELRQTAVQWPFSSVGIELDETVNDQIIFSDPSLKQVYIDRVIQQKDKTRLTGESTKTGMRETTGEYASVIWPHLETVLNK